VEATDLAILAGVGLAYALVSRRLARTIVTSAMVFLAAGIVLGDGVLGWFTVGPSGATLRLIAESTLALVLFTDASRIDLRTLRRELAVPVRLLGIGLPLTIAAGVGAALLTLPGLTVVEAALLAIAVAPTDAALGAAVVSDERVPSRIRQGLNVESGLNDGLCVPLLLIALAFASAEGGTETAPLQLVIEEIAFGVVGGVIAGGAGAFALRWARERQWVASVWAPVVPLMIVGLAYGLATVLHGSGLIATFVAGMAYGTILAGSDEETARVADTLGSAMAAITFFIFGAAILPITLAGLSWAPVVFGVLALTLVRMLPVALALAGLGARLPTVAFLAWFGPRGLASIVFAVLILQAGPFPHLDLILTTISVTILISVYAHGITSIPLTDRYVAWAAAHPRHALHTAAEA